MLRSCQPWLRHIPILGRDDVALGDSGIVEHPGQPVEQGLASAERFSRTSLGVALLDDMRRDRSGEREEAAGLHDSLIVAQVAETHPV